MQQFIRLPVPVQDDDDFDLGNELFEVANHQAVRLAELVQQIAE